MFMKNIQELLFTKNLRRSFLVFTFTAVLSVTLVLTMTGSRIYIDSIEEHAYASTAEMQNQVQKSVDLKLEDIEKTLKLLGEPGGPGISCGGRGPGAGKAGGAGDGGPQPFTGIFRRPPGLSEYRTGQQPGALSVQ